MDAIGDSGSGIPVDEDGDGLTAEEMDIERQIMEVCAKYIEKQCQINKKHMLKTL